MENKLTHFDSKGNAIMVDVSEKDVTQRIAIAKGKIYVNEDVINAIVNVIKILQDAGYSLGSGIRRIAENNLCPLK